MATPKPASRGRVKTREVLDRGPRADRRQIGFPARRGRRRSVRKRFLSVIGRARTAFPGGGADPRSPLELEPSEARDAERLAAALREAGGNVSRVSRRLELPRGTIRHRIHKYRLEHLLQKD